LPNALLFPITTQKRSFADPCDHLLDINAMP
jgi:hypothetical protein